MRFVFLFTALSGSLCAQTIQLSGTVLDKETEMPISFVHIFTKDTKTGTVSATDGKFSLHIPATMINTYLYFSTVDYEIDSLLISRTNVSSTIYLTPRIYALNEIYVIPDSTLLTLLRRAYTTIPDNYPDQPTRYVGFFQESTSDENGNLSKLVEAELVVYKEPYNRIREAPGQIEILKSRIKQLQSSNIGFVGGAFMPVTLDIVLQRNNYIQPQNMANYQYDFIEIKSWEGRDCYSIQFRPVSRDSANITGTILIDKETHAYTLFELFLERPENAHAILGIMKPVEQKSKIVYEQLDGKWYLKSVSTRSKHDNRRLKSPLFSSFDYITTQVQTDSVTPITSPHRFKQIQSRRFQFQTD